MNTNLIFNKKTGYTKNPAHYTTSTSTSTRRESILPFSAITSVPRGQGLYFGPAGQWCYVKLTPFWAVRKWTAFYYLSYFNYCKIGMESAAASAKSAQWTTAYLNYMDSGLDHTAAYQRASLDCGGSPLGTPPPISSPEIATVPADTPASPQIVQAVHQERFNYRKRGSGWVFLLSFAVAGFISQQLFWNNQHPPPGESPHTGPVFIYWVAAFVISLILTAIYRSIRGWDYDLKKEEGNSTFAV